ncbi:MAG TPA: cupin domain-containing protein [Xanthobacteraceae bacterium]|nr:cupin domain-containing protein [Xanthobacteraceae bacterium]
MPKIDIAKASVRTRSVYPDPWGAVTQGREKTALGDVAGLTQFGVNLTRLKPGAASALRHWHETEDEFVYVLEGEIVLIEDGGTTVLRPGDAAGFKADLSNGHHLVNKSQRDALYLEVGTRAKRERAHYSDVDLVYDRDESGFRFSRRSGEPYPKSGG